MVRFRRSSSFCDAYGWVVLTTQWNEWTAIHISFLRSWPTLLLVSPNRALQGFLNLINEHNKNQNNQFVWRPCCLDLSSSPTELWSPPITDIVKRLILLFKILIPFPDCEDISTFQTIENEPHDLNSVNSRNELASPSCSTATKSIQDSHGDITTGAMTWCFME